MVESGGPWEVHVLGRTTIALCAFVAFGTFAFGAFASNSTAHALTNCNVDDMTVDGEEQALFTQINALRAQKGAQALTIAPALTRAATWMANDLAHRSTFGHNDSLGRTPWVRMPDCGYPIPGGENLSAGTERSSGNSAFASFASSPSHLDVMLTPDFKQIGIARVFNASSAYGWYWVTDFGYGAGEAATATPTTAPPPPTAAPPPPPAAAAAAAPQPTAEPAPPAPPVLHLQAGTNLVTWNGSAVSPAEAFASAINWLSVVYWYDAGAGQWQRYGPSLSPKMQTLAMMQPGERYWVIVSRALDLETP